MIAPGQKDLFEQPRHSADADVQWFEKLLRNHGDWLTAAEVLNLVLRKPSDDNKRWIRELASRSEWILSGPGSPGYKHIEHCTPEEIKHFKNALISQGKDMIRRGIKIARSAHQIFG